MKIPTFPFALWWRITDKERLSLSYFQQENYGLNLEIPPEPPYPYLPHIEDSEELERLMRQPPTRRD